MALPSGTRLGAYEVLAKLGEGGMGEVYRARDSKLNRDVALKVLSDAFVNDPDRLARFRREAQVLASLNHPNIAAIYGFEDSGATHALVLELVDGPTLADRIAQGPIPLADALPMATQIAEALEAAHDLGIVHRDLKPANVKVRDDGAVKVLDFGLAKAVDPAASSSVSAINSPTITAAAFAGGYGAPGTQMGMIIGTAAYMSPEQARGRAVDKRADIWAFGVVLFEMLTGQRLFAGDDITDVLAAVIRQEIDWNALPSDTPLRVRQLLERCIDRDVKQRLRDIGEARVELVRIKSGGASAMTHHSGTATAPASVPRWKRALPWALAAAATAALAVVLAMWSPWRAPDTSPAIRVSVEVGGEIATNGIGAATVISPDGTMLAFTALGPEGPQLFVRHLDQLTATPLAGTAGAFAPFFSADNRSIGFFTTGRLMKVAITGGSPSFVSAAAAGRGATWAADDTIYFQPAATATPLMRVSSAGGTSSPVSALADGEATQRWPQVLPGGKAILYSGNNAGTGWEGARLMIQPLPSGAPKLLLENGFHGRYIASGHILYMHGGTLYAVAFDLDRLEVIGQPAPVLDSVFASSNNGGAQFSVSDAGTLVCTAGKGTEANRPMYWMDSTGATTTLRAPGADWKDPRFSPDRQRLAVTINDGTQVDVYLYDWARDTPTKFTFDPASDLAPVWTPNGQRIVFGSDRAKRGVYNLYWQRADGSGDVQRLTDSPHSQYPSSFDPTGTLLAYSESTTTNPSDLMILPLAGNEAQGWKPGTPYTFLSTSAIETAPAFSPDGRWMAYMSDEATLMQTYVRPFPGPGGKQLISAAGVGVYPIWSQAKPELFFSDPVATKIMVAGYSASGTSFRADKPRVWSPGMYLEQGTSRVYDVHPDGKRVAIGKPLTDPSQKRDKVVVVFNFAADVARQMTPPAK